MTIEAAAKRFAVPKSAVARARKDTPSLSIAEIALAAITHNGKNTSGTLSDAGLARVAGWIDYINHDGCTAAEVRSMLQGWVSEGVLAIEGSKWQLLQPWP